MHFCTCFESRNCSFVDMKNDVTDDVTRQMKQYSSLLLPTVSPSFSRRFPPCPPAIPNQVKCQIYSAISIVRSNRQRSLPCLPCVPTDESGCETAKLELPRSRAKFLPTRSDTLQLCIIPKLRHPYPYLAPISQNAAHTATGLRKSAVSHLLKSRDLDRR